MSIISRRRIGILGLCCGLVATAFVSLPEQAASNGRDEKWELVAKELGEVRKFMEDPAPSHDGTRVVYARTIFDGYEVCLRDLSTGKTVRLFRQDEKDLQGGRLRMLGWSPDDRHFAYLRRTIVGELVLVDGVTGIERCVIPVGPFEQGCWVSDEALVYQASANELYEVRLRADGGLQPRRFKLSENTPRISGRLMAYGPEAVVWLRDGVLWSCTPDQPEPTRILAPADRVPVGYAYSMAARTFLLQCRDANGDFLARFQPDTREFTILERIDLPDKAPIPDWVGHLALMNGGKGYAYRTRHESGKDTLVIRAGSGADVVRIEWPGLIRAFAFNDTALFVTGSRGYAPTAVWRYDATSGELAEAVENGASFRQARLVTPVPFEITDRSGRKRLCDLYRPANFEAGRKYPLVIGVPRIGYEQAVANAPAYFACARRFRSEGSEELDFPAISEALLRTESIDPQRVFLLCTSRGTRPAMDLLLNNHEPWAGAIILGPNYVPNFSELRSGRILIDQGEMDAMMTDGKIGEMKAQVALAKTQGLSIEHCIRGGTGHFYRAPRVEIQRIRAIIRFLNQE